MDSCKNTPADRARRLVRDASCALVLFLLNGLISYRLLRFEYTDQLGSVDGFFISFARYLQHHPAIYDWLPMWLAGLPSYYVYQPLLHYAVAALAAGFHISPSSAYHVATLVTYSLGGVAMYCLAKEISGRWQTGVIAGLLFSLFSPSLLFLSDARGDVGGLWNARRLQAMVVYGEGPNVTGLTLCIFALAAFHFALNHRKPASDLGAAFALAAVPATSWPATVALVWGIICLLAARSYDDIRDDLPRSISIGIVAAAITLPFALPSTIQTTFASTNLMGDSPTTGPSRWVAAAGLLAIGTLLRLLISRVPFALRFAALYSLVAGWVVMAADTFKVRIVPLRFHLAWEVGLCLSLAIIIQMLCRWRLAKRCIAVILFVFGGVQLTHYRNYARQIIRPVNVENTLEFQVARWLDQNMNGERVAAKGSVSFRMNMFTDTPQLNGCCDQSISNPQLRVANYIISAGYSSDDESADYSLLWLKAFAVHAISIGGPMSRDYYKDFHFPYRFENRLPLIWKAGDDYIYKIPARVNGLVRIVREPNLVTHPPANGIDVIELRSFVSDLDDENLPIPNVAWKDANSATINASLEPDNAISVAINYDPGWHATANAIEMPVMKDGLGLITLKPRCSGQCDVVLQWSAGWMPQLALGIALLSISVSVVSIFWGKLPFLAR